MLLRTSENKHEVIECLLRSRFILQFTSVPSEYDNQNFIKKIDIKPSSLGCW